MSEENKWNRTQIAMAVIIIIMIAGFIGIYIWKPEEPIVFTKTNIIGVVEIFGVIDDTNYAYVLSQAVHPQPYDTCSR